MTRENPSLRSGDRSFLKHYAWISVGTALLTITMKTAAWHLTGSVGLLSDALESIVNLAGAMMGLAMLTVAAQPADKDHAYGHGKAEYFSSGVEGSLILVAAVCIAYAAIDRLISPRPLEQIGYGLFVSVAASLVNLVAAVILKKAGRKYNSITLEANARHLMTDVWTSCGVLVGVGAVAMTGWMSLDSIVALVVAGNIVFSGYEIIQRSVLGLMDTALPASELNAVKSVIKKYEDQGIQFHALRTRQAASRRFIEIHVLVPGIWTVNQGHELLERIEGGIRETLPNVSIITHLESLDDPASWDDDTLDR